jgi:hypothetical protein
MRFGWILTLALIGATVTASAQQTYKVKPSHQEKSKSGALKATPQHNSNASQLQKIEQETAKSAVGQRSSGRPHVAPVKTQREKANPPIHFSSGTGARSGNAGEPNSSKSRVRTKGRH